MRKYIFIIILPLFFLLACENEDIKLFNGQPQLYFDKFYMNALKPGTEGADSTVMSFFFYPEGTGTIEAQLVVDYSGLPFSKDIPFGLKVIEDGTTAVAEEYTLATEYLFHARPIQPGQRDIQDTISIQLHLSERIKVLENGVRLEVELVPREGVGLGQYERRRAVIVVSNMAEKPDWWDDEVRLNLLGDYSQMKYKLFVQHADPEMTLNKEMITTRPDLAITLVLKFKEWLIENPGQMDENGQEITVVI